ncbi:MAG TPA: 5'/3'-nucleotidase SurE [Methanocorpusculum sp.]|nr:5'/3'-nucleotidase SurE [Methanocorpusculum sp.]
MTRPKILLTNDDGVNSIGLWAAYEALEDFADIVIAAPAVQQSAAARSISIFTPLRMNEVEINGHIAHVIEGKPTDSLLLGLYALDSKPDLVVSGVNLGENLTCESVTTSGTLGAAFEAANQHIPAIAFSYQTADDGDKFIDPRSPKIDFTETKRVILDLVRLFLKDGFPAGADVINVNIPHGKAKGYRATILGSRLFNTTVETRIDPRGKPYHWICGEEIFLDEEGTDVKAVQSGYVSITPLTMDNTAYKSCVTLESMLQKREQ